MSQLQDKLLSKQKKQSNADSIIIQPRQSLLSLSSSRHSKKYNKIPYPEIMQIQNRKTIKRMDQQDPQKVIYTSIITNKFQQQQSFYEQLLILKTQSKQIIITNKSKSFYTCRQGMDKDFQSLTPSSLKLKQQQQILSIIKDSQNNIFAQNSVYQQSKSISQTIINQKTKSYQKLKQTILIRNKKKNSQQNQQKKLFKQKMYSFFGHGMNIMVFHLSNQVINILLINIIIDIIFRMLLIALCFLAFILTNGMQLFLYPLYIEIIARFLMFLTLLKMAFDEKNEISRSFQKAINQRSFVDIQKQRIFIRQYEYKTIIQIIFKCTIPPQLINITIQDNQFIWKKLYLVINFTYKSIEILLVSLIFIFVLRSKQMPQQLFLPAVSLLLQEIVRFICNYLIINTFTLIKSQQW